MTNRVDVTAHSRPFESLASRTRSVVEGVGDDGPNRGEGGGKRTGEELSGSVVVGLGLGMVGGPLDNWCDGQITPSGVASSAGASCCYKITAAMEQCSCLGNFFRPFCCLD